MKMKIAIFLCAVLKASAAFAQHEVGNGGDLIREGFILEGKQILKRVEKSPAAMMILTEQKITPQALDLNLDIHVISVSAEVLVDNTGSVVDALYRDPHIWLNQDSWSRFMIENADVDLLILHELFRAVHFNDDNYVLSSQIIPVIAPQTPETQVILDHATWDAQTQAETPPCGIFCFGPEAEEYQKGVQPGFSDLVGTWILAGSVELPEFPDESMRNAYDENGISIQDETGSSFSPHQINFQTKTAFDGTLQSTVRLAHLGKAFPGPEQGPNRVSLTQLGACFSEWSYGSDFSQGNPASQNGQASQMSDNTYFHYGCRLLAGDASKTKLICAIRSQAAHPETLSPKEKVFVGRTVYYLGYLKIPGTK